MLRLVDRAWALKTSAAAVSARRAISPFRNRYAVTPSASTNNTSNARRADRLFIHWPPTDVGWTATIAPDHATGAPRTRPARPCFDRHFTGRRGDQSAVRSGSGPPRGGHS